MKLYLASRYGRRLELSGYAEELNAMGHCITSRWIRGDHEMKDADPTYEEAMLWADDDLSDIAHSEAFVLFTEADPEMQAGRGGRFVELGYALGLLSVGQIKYVFIVGPRESNIFTCLPEIVNVDDISELADFLERTSSLNPDNFVQNQFAMHRLAVFEQKIKELKNGESSDCL